MSSLLMHIGFDNSHRLKRRVYYFKYKDVRFKLFQNEPRKWSDVLLTIVPRDDNAAQQRAYAAAGEFLSALSWQNSSRVALRNIGDHGVPAGFRLRQAQCRVFNFPQVPFSGGVLGFEIAHIAAVQTEDQRLALALYREASSANKSLLAFLLYWQIIEIRCGDPVGWINKTWARTPHGFHVPRWEIQQLPLTGRTLGEYLLDDCRHAIAHIRRRAGSAALRFDNSDENRRLIISVQVIQQFASYYIRQSLGLTENLYLVRKRGRGFPEYVDATMRKGCYREAYPSWSAPNSSLRAHGPRLKPRR